jgi:hypothetical protein
MSTDRLYCLRVVILGLVVAWVPSLATAQSTPQTADIVVAGTAAAPVKSGADVIRRALGKQGITSRIVSSDPSADLRIYVGQSGDAHLGVVKIQRDVPQKPESFAIAASGTLVVVEGRDATGAMYGAYELADQVALAVDRNLASRIAATSKSPFLEIRGVNMFLTVQDIDDADGAFWSDDYWNIYLGMMARNRYNFLDIHGPCDAVTLTFPNGFSYFVTVPGFPEVGVGPERAAKNLARFRQVIRMAGDYGIKVGYMNYEAPAPIGPWKTRKWGVDERWTNKGDEFLDGPRLEEYTRLAVLSLVKQLPELWMFGFRIGESGQPEDFYKKTYLAALAELPPSLRIYLRTWIAGPKNVRDLAASTKHPLYIEPKYNGEQLGLPYQATLGGRQYPPSGSYEDYTNSPKNYSILWQIRAHGTHRVFYWGSPEFARRTVRSCKFGDGVGFSMEPMEAYLVAPEYLHHNPKTDHGFYKWMVERQWVWHTIWGRTAYDPDVPDQVFVNAFIEHFGAQAGPVVFEALRESSKIIPFIYAYHSVGMDHQQFAPELENGDHAFGARVRLWQGTRLAPYGGNNDDYLRVEPLDRTAMADPMTYVNNRLNGIASGKMTPFEAADYLDQAATASEEKIAQAAAMSPTSAQHFDCIRRDIEAVAWLARYYRDRTRSATHLAFYKRTTDHTELVKAHEFLNTAVHDWDRLADIADEHYGFVPDYIRMGVKDFKWRDEGRGLGVDLDQIDNLETTFRNLPRPGQYGQYGVVIGHAPPERARPGQPLKLTATFATASEDPHVYLFSRSANESGFTKLELTRENEFERTWSGELPASRMTAGTLEYYFEADSGRWGNYGSSGGDRSTYRVLVNDGSTKPTLAHTPPAAGARGDAISLTVAASAPAGIAAVNVYYKRMPSYHEWQKIEMKTAGGSQYSASVPLTNEGILYYFEAIARDGTAANYPNFLERTPYFVIDSWDTGR